MEPKPRFLGTDYARQFRDPAVAAVYRKRPAYPEQLFDLLTELLPHEGARVLDVGAGTGEIAIPMSARSATVDAVEPSAAMLAIARAQTGSARVNWHNLPAESFAPTEPYGLIVCAQCLGWLDWEIVFPLFAAALTRRGWLAIVSQVSFADMPWNGELTALIAAYSTNQDFEPFDLLAGIETRGLFQPAATRAIRPEPLSQEIDHFIDSIHARNGFSRDRMAPSAVRDFDAQVRRLLEKHHPDGRLHGTCSASVTWGRPMVPAGS
jgi:SAM-dependent methyltransferase